MIAICMCGHLMVFGDDLLLREPTSAEIIDMAGDPTMLQAQRMLLKYRKWKKRVTRKRKRRSQ